MDDLESGHVILIVPTLVPKGSTLYVKKHLDIWLYDHRTVSLHDVFTIGEGNMEFTTQCKL